MESNKKLTIDFKAIDPSKNKAMTEILGYIDRIYLNMPSYMRPGVAVVTEASSTTAERESGLIRASMALFNTPGHIMTVKKAVEYVASRTLYATEDVLDMLISYAGKFKEYGFNWHRRGHFIIDKFVSQITNENEWVGKGYGHRSIYVDTDGPFAITVSDAMKACIGPNIRDDMFGATIEAEAALNAIFGTKSIKKEEKETTNMFEIKEVIYNDPATIVLWEDGTKTVVKAHNDKFDPEKGLAMAISKKALGNKHDYYVTFLKNLPKQKNKKNIPHTREWDADFVCPAEEGSSTIVTGTYRVLTATDNCDVFKQARAEIAKNRGICSDEVMITHVTKVHSDK